MGNLRPLCLVLLAAAGEALASGGGPRVLTLALPEASTVLVVAEGDLEPRSIGSYGVRAYAVADPRFPYDRFVSGVIRPRDGSVERVVGSDLDGDGSPEVVVVVRSAGTGGYLSADAFRLDGAVLSYLASVSGLPKDADPVRALAVAVAQGAAPRAGPDPRPPAAGRAARRSAVEPTPRD